jgi:hypothetical protein
MLQDRRVSWVEVETAWREKQNRLDVRTTKNYHCGHQSLTVESMVATSGLEDPEFESLQAQGIYIFSKTSRPFLGLTNSVLKWNRGLYLQQYIGQREGVYESVELYLHSFCAFIACTGTRLGFILCKQEIEPVLRVVGFSVIIVPHV